MFTVTGSFPPGCLATLTHDIGCLAAALDLQILPPWACLVELFRPFLTFADGWLHQGRLPIEVRCCLATMHTCSPVKSSRVAGSPHRPLRDGGVLRHGFLPGRLLCHACDARLQLATGPQGSVWRRVRPALQPRRPSDCWRPAKGRHNWEKARSREQGGSGRHGML